MDDVRNFTSLLASLEDGELNQELSEALKELAGDLQSHAAERGGKPKGTITLKVDLKFADGVFEVQADVGVKAPKASRRRSIFWATPDNNLTPVNPRQGKLPLHTVVTSDGEIKKA